MNEKQFQEAVAALWQHVQAAKVLQDSVGLTPSLIEQVNAVTSRKLKDLENALHIEPRLKT
jgi:hypothetical protein